MPKRIRVVDVGLVAFAIAYPPLVFFLRGTVNASLFIIMALTALGLRLLWGGMDAGYWRPALLISAGAIAGLALLNATLAARAYPVVLSLAIAGVFAITLLGPTSLVERFALASGEVWSPELRAYCRKVTAIWALWLAINAVIAAGLAFSGYDRAWAIWTGALSYLVSGLLFAGEWLVRRRVAQHRPRR
jgi:uncharacterized membrane protein